MLENLRMCSHIQFQNKEMMIDINLGKIQKGLTSKLTPAILNMYIHILKVSLQVLLCFWKGCV